MRISDWSSDVCSSDLGFASAMNHVTFGFGNVFGVALGGLCMSLAFEHYTGVRAANMTTENPAGFVAPLNTTFMAAIGLTVIADRKRVVSGKSVSVTCRSRGSQIPLNKTIKE